MTTNHSSAQARTARAMLITGALVLALPVTGLVAYERATASRGSATGVQEVSIRASDFAFDMPTTLHAGVTQFRLTNGGMEPHHLWILKLEDGKTLDDVFAALKSGGPFPAWARSIGGPNASAPGANSVAQLRLELGNYAALCFIPSPDGMPHAMKGMAKAFVVTGEPSRAEPAVADIEATLNDYDFVFSKPIAAGRQSIRFRNTAGQIHEAFIAKLEPGKKAADLAAWLAKPQGPPPGTPMGGITGIAPGASVTIAQDFTPGTYALYCFVPDAKDGKEHIAHGMMKEFVIPAR